MNPTDPAFPPSLGTATVLDESRQGMDLRTYMATAFLAAMLAQDELLEKDALLHSYRAVAFADALIERLNAK